MNKILIANDFYRPNDSINNTRISSKIEIYNEDGELIFEPLHNKTVIAGSALTAMKLFNLNSAALNLTPTYDELLGLDNDMITSSGPVINITDSNANITNIITNESNRRIIGFCVGKGGSGLGISDVYNVKYCDCILPDNLIPFRYPSDSGDDVDESIYKGKKALSNNRIAYYFKTFNQNPTFYQNYTTSNGNSIDKNTVYSNTNDADNAQTCIELHLKITKEDCREYFIAHSGLENAVINQISLVSGWSETVELIKNGQSVNVEYYKDIRPFSLLNIPNDGLSDLSKSISIIYTLYF